MCYYDLFVAEVFEEFFQMMEHMTLEQLNEIGIESIQHIDNQIYKFGEEIC